MVDDHTPPSGDESELAERAKYTDKQVEALGAKGHAFKNPDGSHSYPIADADDLGNAIHAVGRGGSDHDAIRKYIIGRAQALGLSDRIPDGWNADGSIKQQNQRKRERRRAVPLLPEVRHWRAEGLEIREAKTTNEIVISGSPIVYDTPYTVRDMFGEFSETMRPGVAAKVLASGADVRFLFNHDGLPLARSTSGTLKLEDGPTSLRFSAVLDARQQLANDLAIAIERGDITQMSCGFVVARDQWDDDFENREISEFADLLDVSAVTYPASPTTDIAIAQRMAMQMPVETWSRLRQLEVDIRAGKTFSATTTAKVQAVAHALGELAKHGGVDIGNLTSDTTHDPDGDAPPSGVGSANDTDGGISRLDDGTVGGGVTNDGSPGYADGTGTRSNHAARLRLKRAVRGI